MLSKWCEITSCNGIIDLYDARNNKKHFIFWAVVVVTMMCMSSWFTYRTIMGYIQSPYITTVSTVVTEKLDMPEVLVCYNGGLNVTAMEKEKFSPNFTVAFNGAYRPIKPSVDSSIKNIINKELQAYLAKHQTESLRDFATKFGFDCNEMVTSFSLPFGPDIACSKASKWVTDRGVCYAFQNLDKQWFPSYEGGLKLTLKVPNNSFVDKYPLEAENLGMNKEFSIILEKSLGRITSMRSLLVPIRTKLEITLNTKRYKRLTGGRFSNDRCSSATETFTSNACYFDCFLQSFQLQAMCLPMHMLGSSVNASIHNDSSPLPAICNYFELTEITNQLDLKFVQLCQNSCLPLCDEWIYEAMLSYSPLSFLQNNRSTSYVAIFYNTMQYTQIEEVEAFTTDMAIANVGGQSGLWLGISVTTIIQALYYLVISCWPRFGSKNKVQEQEYNAKFGHNRIITVQQVTKK